MGIRKTVADLAARVLKLERRVSDKRDTRIGFFDDFMGGPSGSWTLKDTSTSGTPVYGVNDAPSGRYSIQLDSLDAANPQVVTLYYGDSGPIYLEDLSGISQGVVFEMSVFIVPQTGGTNDAATILAFGLASEQNDTLDSVAEAIWVRMEGANMNLLLEADDGTNTFDDYDTGLDAVDSQRIRFKIDATDTSSVKCFIDIDDGNGYQYVKDVNFGSIGTQWLQPFVQIQKGAAAGADDAIEVDWVEWSAKRYPLPA